MFSEYSERCGKVMFLSKADADRQIVEREAARGDWFGHSYNCRICKKWHITTTRDSADSGWENDLKEANFSQRDSWDPSMSQSLSSSLDEESLRKLKNLFDQ